MNAAEVTRLLIEGGAEVNAEDRDGETPLDFAIYREYDEMQSLIKEHGGWCNNKR